MKRPFTETQAVTTADLQQRIERLYNHLYANAPVRTPAGIANEVGKLLHTAIYIEELEINSHDSPAFLFQPYQLKKLFQADKPLCEEVAKGIRDKFSKMNRAWRLYPKGEQILLSDSDIGYTCGQLSGVVVSDRNRDVFGDALEIFRSQWTKREGGQFFTDQRVTALAMTLLDFDPRRGDDLVDICSGTGGFLLAGLNRIRALIEADSQDGSVETKLLALASASLKGQEIDAEVSEIANATLKSRLSNAPTPFVILADSLKPNAFDSSNKRIRYNSHLCAATNPPFGTKITVKDISILSAYELARTRQRASPGAILEDAVKFSNRAPDTLFIEQNVKLLKPGAGRLAIVVPYQILSGPQTHYVREWLLRHTDIIAVVDLPADTFQPHTGTKAGLLLVRRRKEPLRNLSEAKDHDIFMAMPRWIGHDRRGKPIYKRMGDGTYTGEILSDFNDVERAFKAFQQGDEPGKEHPESFKLRLSSILSDPNLHLNALFHRNSQPDGYKGKTNKKWRYARVRDVVESIFYPTRFKRDYVDYYDGAVPFLGGSNISQMIITTDKWLREDNPNLESLRVRAGWILITRSGSTGIVSSVPAAWDGYAMSEHIIRIVPNPEKLDPYYLQAFLRTKYAQAIISRGVFGSVIDEITPEYIGDMEIPIPRSEAVMRSVIAKMKNAEEGRNTAIESLTEAVDDLNRELQGSPAHYADVALQSAP
jgi:type I restriction-modification system DNA methylase subunit